MYVLVTNIILELIAFLIKHRKGVKIIEGRISKTERTMKYQMKNSQSYTMLRYFSKRNTENPR